MIDLLKNLCLLILISGFTVTFAFAFAFVLIACIQASQDSQRAGE